MNASPQTEAPPERPGIHFDHGLEPYVEGTAGEAWALVWRLFFAYGKPRFPTVAADLGLSPPQAMLLRLLAAPQPMSVLAEAMHCDNSNLTGLADRLEERGLAERRPDPHDRRVKLIAPTEEGVRLREELNRRLAEPPEALLGLSADDQDTLVAILRKAVAN